MGIRESALSVISAIAQGDFVRAVTSDGNSRRVTVANLAKAIVESYTGSSLGGSQRSIKAAIDDINNKIIIENVTSSSITIAVNDRGVYSIPIAKSGYTILGIVGLALANNWLFVGGFAVYGNNAQVIIHNRTTSSQTSTVTLTVLYAKA